MGYRPLDKITDAKKVLKNAKMQIVLVPNLKYLEADAIIASAETQLTYAEELNYGIETGAPVPCVPDNVTFMNSLQAAWAYRFVMSGKPSFALAELMLRENPQLRKGRSMRMN